MTEVRVGDSGPTVRVEDLSRTDIVKYAGASGDFNPLHHDEPYARAAGNASVFGHGMLTAGVASTFVTEWFGVGAVRAFETRFEGQVWPGDSLVVTGEVTAVDRAGEGASVGREGAETTVGVEFAARTDDDRTVLTGSATVVR